MQKILFLFTAVIFTFSAFSQKEEAQAFLKKAQTKIDIGDYAAAITELNKAVEKDPANLNIYLKRAFCYGATTNFQGAVDDYSKVIELKPDLESAYVSRGSAKNKLKKYTEAVMDFDKALQLKPDDFDAYNNRGWAKKGMGDDDGACKDWRYSKKKGNGEAKIILENNRCK